MHDVTRKKQAEEALKDIEMDGKGCALPSFFDMREPHQLEAQKREAIATLAGGVAHEFNNALASVMGCAELLRMELSGRQEYNSYFEAIDESCRRMSRLTSQLLAYAQGGKYQPRRFDLARFVAQSLPMLKNNIKPSVKVQTHLLEDTATIVADQNQMQMVLSALLSNSDEAMEHGGVVFVSVENKELADIVDGKQAGHPPGRYVCLSVKDEGKGMSEEEKARIFDPFFTTKFQGRGMSMAAVYGIVKNHGGWISVDSEPGKGTLVRIYIPKAAGEGTDRGK